MNNNISSTENTEPLKKSLELFLKWNEEGIKYCHWKGNNHLLDGMRGLSDMDVLMTQSSKERGTQILSELCFIKVKPQFGSAFPNVEDWIGCDSESGKMLHVHLHFDIVSGHHGLKEYLLPFAEELISSRVKDDLWGVYIADPSLELLMLYTRIGLKVDYKGMMKALIGRYYVSKHDMPEIIYLKLKYKTDKLSELAQKYYGRDKDTFLNIIRQEKYDSKWLIKLHRIALKAFGKYNRLKGRAFFPRVYYRFAISFRNLLRRKVFPYMITKKTIPNGQGIIALFIGQDGAGKSTVTHEAVKWLSWKMDAKRFYFGSGDGYRSISKRISDKLKGKKGIFFLIRSLLVVNSFNKIAKKHLTLAKKMKKYISKGGIAICDRYPQFQFEGINDGPNIRALKKRVNNKFVRKYLDLQAKREENYIRKTIVLCPDIVFKLMLPVEESMRRKPEENKELVIKKNRIVEELRFGEKELVLIDANQEISQEIAQIHSILWKIICSNAVKKEET